MAGLIAAGRSGGLTDRATGAADTSARSLELAASSGRAMLEFAYVDETGDTGHISRGASRTFTLGCVLVPAEGWSSRLEAVTETRRRIKEDYGLRLRDELKANYLIRPRGPLKGKAFGHGQLRDIYRRNLRALSGVAKGVFAVVVDKKYLPNVDPFLTAWECLLRQLIVRTSSTGNSILLVHDEGEDDKIRKLHRRCRQQTLSFAGKDVCAELLVEDPVARRSELSYFTQAADLTAYAAFRRVQPPVGRVASVCDGRMWEELKSIWLTEVSQSRSDGIVVWPEKERGHP